MTDPTVFTIVCSPDGPGWHHSTDSVLIDGDCGHDVWIAPTNRANHANPFMNTRAWCLPCAMADPELEKSLREDGMHTFPGVRDELNRELGVAETDQLFARFRIKTWKADQ